MKIAILGSAPSSRLMAPYDDPSWEIWACSPSNMDLPRIDTFFELHGMDRLEADPQYADYLPWLMKCPKVYLQKKDPRYSGSIEYPVNEMLAKYGKRFFTSSIAWMFSEAIEKKPEKIGLYGVDMSTTVEYGFQRAGVQYFVGKAEEAGIEVIAPPESDILEPPPLYGYVESSRMWRKLEARRLELLGRVNAVHSQRQELALEEPYLRGALDNTRYVLQTFGKQGAE